MQERENILRIFQEVKKAVELGDSAAIRNLSNQTNNTAALTQDPDNISVAVVVYAMSKIIERQDYEKLPGWNKFYKIHVDSIEKKIGALKKGNDEAFRREIVRIRKAIGDLSGQLKVYIRDVFRKASINRASKLYEHGISMERTASLLGITLFELADYAGSKELSDAPQIKTVDVKARIRMAMEMFE
ncbi:MAG TPA: hypothetical protein VJ142_00160 [Candidatus Nanoarchaeia archaeon]|nr:hypothetical protein [Candidatus Nanoarchaeia archaeon]